MSGNKHSQLLLLFLYAIMHAMSPTGKESAQIALWAGALTQFISAVTLFSTFQCLDRFATLHVCLERTNRFLLANTMCDSLGAPARDEVRRLLIDIVACAPMLTVDGSAQVLTEPSGSTQTEASTGLRLPQTATPISGTQSTRPNSC